MDQRGKTNQRRRAPGRGVAGASEADALLGANQAAQLLGVKKQTLYAYVSRGWIRRVPESGGPTRDRRYLRADVERLKARHDARSGHGPVAAGALRWGEPVLESGLTHIDEHGPSYRGVRAVDLVSRAASYESVCELLWRGDAAAPVHWSVPALELGLSRRALDTLLPESPRPIEALSLLVPALAVRDHARFDAPADAEWARGRTLIHRLAAALALGQPGGAERVDRALAESSVARAVLVALGGEPRPAAVRLVENALIVCADHELNPSSFAARVAAGAGADLYGCIAAALATATGPKHGGACDRVEALVAEIDRAGSAKEVVFERSRRGEAIPGFGHPLYPAGDPRAKALLPDALAMGRAGKQLAEVAAAMKAAGREPPTVDFALVAIARVLGLVPGAALALFVMGRSAGWIAQALEQRAAGYVLRPRARYTGPGAPVEAE